MQPNFLRVFQNGRQKHEVSLWQFAEAACTCFASLHHFGRRPSQMLSSVASNLRLWIKKWGAQQCPNTPRNAVHDVYPLFTLWLFNIAMENGPCIDDFPS